MNGEVSVRDVMRREYVGVSEADTLKDTASLMLSEDVETVVVMLGSEPVGMVTERDVLSAAVDGHDLGRATVSDVMQQNPPTVSYDASLATATDTMSGTESRHVLVVDGAEVVGVLSEHDVVTASTLTHATDAGPGPEMEAEAVVTEAVAGTDETSGTDDFSNQGICELCGSLSRSLSTFNGQLVCADCRDV